MIKHIVFLKFKPEASDTDVLDLEEKLGRLPAAIPEIKQYEFGRDIIKSQRSYDFALVSAFDNMNDLKTYQVHPNHVVVLQKVLAVSESVLAVDFEH